MLHDYYDITEGVVIKKAHRVEKRDKLKQEPRKIVAKLLKYIDKEYILPSKRHRCLNL